MDTNNKDKFSLQHAPKLKRLPSQKQNSSQLSKLGLSSPTSVPLLLLNIKGNLAINSNKAKRLTKQLVKQATSPRKWTKEKVETSISHSSNVTKCSLSGQRISMCAQTKIENYFSPSPKKMCQNSRVGGLSSEGPINNTSARNSKLRHTIVPIAQELLVNEEQVRENAYDAQTNPRADTGSCMPQKTSSTTKIIAKDNCTTSHQGVSANVDYTSRDTLTNGDETDKGLYQMSVITEGNPNSLLNHESAPVVYSSTIEPGFSSEIKRGFEAVNNSYSTAICEELPKSTSCHISDWAGLMGSDHKLPPDSLTPHKGDATMDLQELDISNKNVSSSGMKESVSADEESDDITAYLDSSSENESSDESSIDWESLLNKENHIKLSSRLENDGSFNNISKGLTSHRLWEVNGSIDTCEIPSLVTEHPNLNNSGNSNELKVTENRGVDRNKGCSQELAMTKKSLVSAVLSQEPSDSINGMRSDLDLSVDKLTPKNIKEPKIIVKKLEISPVRFSKQVLKQMIQLISGKFIQFLFGVIPCNFACVRSILFNDEELAFAENFMKLSDSAQNIYSRLFISRPDSWIRVSDYLLGHEDSLKQLKIIELVTFDLLSDSLSTLLDLLYFHEVKAMYKIFCFRGKERSRKKMVEELLKSTNQELMFSSTTSQTREKHLKLWVQETVKSCVKLSSKPKDFIRKLVIIASYAHFFGDENQMLYDLLLKLNTLQSGIIYPPGNSEPSLVFHSTVQFNDYRESLSLFEQHRNAVDAKDFGRIEELTTTAERKLWHFLKDKHYKSLLDVLPDFLFRFTSGYIFARIIWKGINLMVDKRHFQSVIAKCELLLSQCYFGAYLRGQWALCLTKIYKENDGSEMNIFKALQRGLSDDQTDLISKRSLSHEAKKLIENKCCRLTPFQKITLTNLMQPNSFKPLTVEIQTGFRPEGPESATSQTAELRIKKVVSEYYENKAPKKFSVVKDDKGKLLINLVLMIFWDEIYGKPEGLKNGESVYHSLMQTHPLDWCTQKFYERRKISIEEKINLLDMAGICEILKVVPQMKSHVKSIVSWDVFPSLSSIQEFLKCLGVNIFCNIARHLLKDYRLHSKGFPHFTMWNPTTSECLFVEFKSSKSHVSEAQMYWLETLHSFGACCELCIA